MNKDSQIYVAGHTGLVGSAVVRELERRGYSHYSASGDLRRSDDIEDIFLSKPEYVFMCAAHAGGIKEAMTHPADMLADNMMMIANVFRISHDIGVIKLINFFMFIHLWLFFLILEE